MAHAYYIPDQNILLRRAWAQEQQILRTRKYYWALMLTVFYELLYAYILYERRVMGNCRRTCLL